MFTLKHALAFMINLCFSTIRKICTKFYQWKI